MAVQISLFEHGRTFVQCCTVFLYSTNCTQFRKFLKPVLFNVWWTSVLCCTLFLYSKVQTVNRTQTLELYTTEQLYVCLAVHKLLKAKQKLKIWQLLPPDWANAPTDRGEGSYPPVLQRGGKALKLSSSHSPPKRLSPGVYLWERNPCRVLDSPSRQTGQERLTMNTECMVPHGANQTRHRIIFHH